MGQLPTIYDHIQPQVKPAGHGAWRGASSCQLVDTCRKWKLNSEKKHIIFSFSIHVEWVYISRCEAKAPAMYISEYLPCKGELSNEPSDVNCLGSQSHSIT